MMTEKRVSIFEAVNKGGRKPDSLGNPKIEYNRKSIWPSEEDRLSEIVPEETELVIMSTEEIIRQSVAVIDRTDEMVKKTINEKKISDPFIDYNNSLNDPRMGPSEIMGKSISTPCSTCNRKNTDATLKDKRCPGHLGHVNFQQAIIHPLYTKEVTYILYCVCPDCGHLLMSLDEFDSNSELKMLQGIDRLKKIQELSAGKNKCTRAEIAKENMKRELEEEFYSNIDNYAINLGYINGFRNDPLLKEEVIKGIKNNLSIIVTHTVTTPELTKIINYMTDILKNRIMHEYEKIDKYGTCKSLPKKITFDKDSVKAKVELKSGGEVYFVPDFFPWESSSHNRSIKMILNNIPIDHARRLGFGKHSHPRRMVSSAWPVVPSNTRPAYPLHGQEKPHALTSFYNEIIEYNVKMKELLPTVYNNNVSRVSYENAYNSFTRSMYHLIYNTDGSYKPGKDHQKWEGLSKAISGKTGRFRGGSLGKRVDYAGRSVASPDVALTFGQISPPETMAQFLTVRETVTIFNIKVYQSELDAGRVRFVQRGENKFKPIGITDVKRKILRSGDIIERYLRNGDQIIFNRQPTLHSHSMMSAEVVLSTRRTPGAHMAYTKPLNLDFDGDEINFHSPQEIGARVEAIMLMNVKEKIIDPKNNRNIMGAVMDAVTGTYVLTWKNATIPDVIWHQVLQNKTLSDYTRYQLRTLADRWDKHYPDQTMNTGRALFSAILPSDFRYDSGKDEDKVVIRDGILVEGRIRQQHIGIAYNSIVQTIHKNYSSSRAAAFINDIFKIIDPWFSTYGQSIGYGDCKIDKVSKEDLQRDYHKKRTVDIRSFFILDEFKAKKTQLMKEWEELETDLRELSSDDKDTIAHIRKIISNIKDKIKDIDEKADLIDDDKFIVELDSGELKDFTRIFNALTNISSEDQVPLDQDWMKYYNNTDQLDTLESRYNDETSKLKSKDSKGLLGRKFISSTLPKEFSWRYGSDLSSTGINDYIRNGILLEPIKFSEIKNFLKHLSQTYGNTKMINILADLRLAIARYYGDDIRPLAPVEAEVAKTINKTRMEMASLGEVPSDPAGRDYYEKLAMGYLNTANSSGQAIIKQNLSENNNIVTSIKAGTKGNMLNLGQINGTIGHQSASGKFIQQEMTDSTRVLPAFLPGDMSLESRGMIVNSFATGMSPVELIFHQMATRYQLIDTAVKTGDSGAIFRAIGEILKNVKVSPDLSVRNGAGGIVQPTVYQDGLDPATLVRVGMKSTYGEAGISVPSFIDVKYLAGRINARYGVK